MAYSFTVTIDTNTPAWAALVLIGSLSGADKLDWFQQFLTPDNANTVAIGAAGTALAVKLGALGIVKIQQNRAPSAIPPATPEAK